MTAVNVDQLEHWEEPSDQRQHIVGYIVTFCTADNQCLAVIADLIRVTECEITHLVETRGEDLDWDTKP